MNKIGALVPIRLASERLPGKAIKEICGKKILCHLLDRIFESKYVEKSNVVVCTTEEKSDDPLVEIVRNYGGEVYRGSTDDIIDRFSGAIDAMNFDAVIQVDGDDILCDTEYMDLSMEKLLGDRSLDIVVTEELPLGIGCKSFTRYGMEKVLKQYKPGTNDTGFIYYFTKTGICNKGEVFPLKESHIMDDARLTLDYPEDLRFFTRIFEELYKEGRVFGLEEILDLLRSKPEIKKINAGLDEIYWQRTKEKAILHYMDGRGERKNIQL